jgi:large subunit ribosomal protein L34
MFDFSASSGYTVSTMSFTYKPKKRKRAKTHGFLTRKKTKGGRNTLLRRMRKGRARLSVSK